MALRRRRDGRYGYVCFDNPPVNAIGQAVRQALLDAVLWAEAEGLERVILSGHGRAFAAGADTREFDHPPEPPDLPDVLNRIEKSPVHWIAAISGVALGGGAEVVLACRYRIARPDAAIGFPEVLIGLIPGAGGTQRLPRLIGLDKALEMIPTGKRISGEKAKAIGLIDEVDDDPVAHAELVNSEWLDMAVPVGELNSGQAAPAAYEEARRAVTKKMRGQQAPLKAIELLELAETAPLDGGLKAEREAFLALRGTDQAKALRHIVFTEFGAKAPGWLDEAPDEIDHVAVVGGGTMGSSIAYALLNAGMTVTLIETDSSAVERAEVNVERIIEASVKRGLIDEAGAASRRQRLSLTDDYEQAAEAGLAIEAAFESMDVKKEIFGKLATAMGPGAVLATNTSYLDVNEIAETIDDPSRVMGLHFFAPAHIMKLLEIVRGEKSSKKTLVTGFALAKRLKKIPVLAGVCDGFIGNRLHGRYREAADTLLMDGALPWDIDEAMVRFGYAMGPYETQDLSGLDIAHANRRRLDATRDPNRRYVPIGDRMVDEGRLGRKTGAGWYRYPEGGGKAIEPLVEELILKEARIAKVERRTFTADEIRHCLLCAAINEAADILHEGIADKASDIDLVTVNGYGFPRYRGGLMHYADGLGPKAVLEALNRFAEDDALVWKPSPLIQDCAARGVTFAEWRRA